MSTKYMKQNENMMNNNQNTYGAWSPLTDTTNHLAQGLTFGWSDEMMGGIGGVGRGLGNVTMRALGYPLNEGFLDAVKNGYKDYRDFARQELNAGYNRHPVLSSGAEVVGSVMSPVRLPIARSYRGSFGNIIAHPVDVARNRLTNSVATAFANGIGSTDNNTWGNYAWNIGTSLVGNALGHRLGNGLYGAGNQMYEMQRGLINMGVQSIPYFWRYNNEKKTY